MFCFIEQFIITVYYHNGNWHFGSSSCPDINSSKFSNKDKSYGYMFDEILYSIYKNQVNIDDPNISSILRNLFTSNLSPLYSYDFVIIHNDNKPDTTDLENQLQKVYLEILNTIF
jgi:hypothetical protein